MNIRYLFIFTLLAGFSFLALSSKAYGQAPARDLYEIKIYHIQNQDQEKQIDQFLQKSYIPAMHRAGVNKVGVFKPIEDDTTHGKMVYVFIPYTSAEQFMKVPEKLENDKKYKADGKGFLNAPHDNPPYQRIESILVKAFEGMPRFQQTKVKTPPSERIYELRSYEGATDYLFKNKMEMFNKGEIEIFENLDFNAIFYGEVIAGSHMPNLMYMTTFADRATRDAHWEAFGTDPAWVKLKGDKQFENKVSHMDLVLLHPTNYSDL